VHPRRLARTSLDHYPKHGPSVLVQLLRLVSPATAPDVPENHSPDPVQPMCAITRPAPAKAPAVPGAHRQRPTARKCLVDPGRFILLSRGSLSSLDWRLVSSKEQIATKVSLLVWKYFILKNSLTQCDQNESTTFIDAYRVDPCRVR
jgi:hypothetical protein